MLPWLWFYIDNNLHPSPFKNYTMVCSNNTRSGAWYIVVTRIDPEILAKMLRVEIVTHEILNATVATNNM
jgi:hypothetical protein